MIPEEEVPRRRAGDHDDPQPHISDGAANIGTQIKRSLRILVAATILLYVVLGAFILITRLDANKSAKALCALRRDAESRLDEGQRFLRTHKHGFSGISRAEIQRSIDGYRITVRALNILNCDAPRTTIGS